MKLTTKHEEEDDDEEGEGEETGGEGQVGGQEKLQHKIIAEHIFQGITLMILALSFECIKFIRPITCCPGISFG